MNQSHTEWAYADLFSGCGGMSAGLAATDRFVPVYAADNDKWANATYAANLGHAPEQLDLLTLQDEDLRVAWAEQVRARAQGKPFLLTGGPPCQGFSSHVKVRGDRKGRNQLFSVFGDLAVALRPDVVMIENVADLVSSRSWDLFDELRSKLREAGYGVRARILNMAQLGVPQERFRTVVLATLNRTPTFPQVRCDPSNFSTVKDWIGHLPPIASGEPNPADPMHVTSRHRASTIEILRQVPQDGGSRPAGVGPECLDRTRGSHGGYTDVYGRLAWSGPAPTITARCRTPSCGRFAHPEQDRGMTAREAGLLQTFPADWQFAGPFDDRYKQIGNAVPPLAAQAFGDHIADGMPEVASEVGLFEVEDKPVGSSFSVLIPGIRRRGGVLNP
ncbi:DNA cytosine methyltransferase [Streptomyces sp. NPDC002889]|uniref:DNA cytosine methyltransferase n=1 Tax=Streptomyces sp. NPDC002889 TaxID=3364669 RepID=UPI0036AD4188